VHGEPGLDEISPLDKTRVVEVKDGATNQWTIDPAKYGYTGFSAADLAGGDAAENARIVTEALTSARARTRFAGARAAVVLNAAAAIYVSGKAGNYDQGVEMAREALDAGEGLAALERLRGAYSSAPD